MVAQPSLQYTAALEVFPNAFVAYWSVVTIFFQDVFEPLVQVDNVGMDDALIGIENKLLGMKLAFAVAIFRKIKESYMLTYYFGYFGIAVCHADSRSDLGVVAALLQTLGLGNIVEQGTGNDEPPGWQGRQGRMAIKPLPYPLGNPGNGEAVSADIVEHEMFIHHMQAGRYGWSGVCHDRLLFAAQLMDEIHAIFGLLRRCELMDPVAEIENMTKGTLGVIEQSFYAGP